MPANVKASQNGNSLDGEPRYQGLERERVASIQRGRMLVAMTEVAVDRGAANVTVSHVVGRSGVSRRTFYEMFKDREDCLLAAVEEALCVAAERVLDAYRVSGSWRDRAREALTALLELFDEEPVTGRLLVTEMLAAGPSALQRRQQVLDAVIAAVDEGRQEAKRDAELSRLTAEGVVGAVLSVVHARMLEADESELLSLRNDLMAIVVLPYLGPAAARRELARPVPSRPARRQPKRRDALSRLGTRLTYRTVRVLMAIAAHPGASNRRVADAAGISDPGQVSKLLARLLHLGLIEKDAPSRGRGEPNAWRLTDKGRDVQGTIAAQAEQR